MGDRLAAESWSDHQAERVSGVCVYVFSVCALPRRARREAPREVSISASLHHSPLSVSRGHDTHTSAMASPPPTAPDAILWCSWCFKRSPMVMVVRHARSQRPLPHHSHPTHLPHSTQSRACEIRARMRCTLGVEQSSRLTALTLTCSSLVPSSSHLTPLYYTSRHVCICTRSPLVITSPSVLPDACLCTISPAA